jgi:hypothetical protein
MQRMGEVKLVTNTYGRNEPHREREDPAGGKTGKRRPESPRGLPTFAGATATAAKAADKAIREYPYQTIGIAFGLGILVGVLLCRNGRD